MGINFNSLAGLARIFTKSVPNAGKLIGTSASGIKVYEATAQNGSRVLTSYKNGSLFKEVTREADQFSRDGSHSFNTIVKDYNKGEYITKTKHLNKAGKTTCVCSGTKKWDGIADATEMGQKPFIKTMSQCFKNGKMWAESRLKDKQFVEKIHEDARTTTIKSGAITLNNGQVHKHHYQVNEYTNVHGQKSRYIKPRATSGLEVTDKGVTFLPSFYWQNYSGGPAYFKKH